MPIYQTHAGDPFSQADREKFLVGMMKVNFLKRLESSVESFEITMGRTIGKIEDLERKIRNYQATPNQNPESEELELNIELAGSGRRSAMTPWRLAVNSNIAWSICISTSG